MAVIQILLRRDTAANWAANNPILGLGETGLDTTSMRVKIGTGSTTWNLLPYQMNTVFNGAGAPAGALGVNGDIYFDNTNKGYHVKAAGAWGSIISLQGAQGIQGIPGTPGTNGQGVPTGGTVGQYLRKTSATDYATAWAGISSGEVSGLGSLATVSNLTGHVTSVGAATTIPNGTVTNAMQANMPANTLSGNNTGAPAAPIDLTPTQVTAMLDLATASAKGLMAVAEKQKISGMYYDVVAQGGADPTGAVDATAIIQSAINTVGAAGGGVVYFPVGTYRVSSNINISNPYVTLRGASRVKTLIKSWVATGNVFTAVSGAHFTRWETMRIEGGDGVTGTLRTAGYAIEAAAGANNCSCQWIDILFHWSGVKASGQLFRLEDMNIREMGMHANNGCGILNDTFTDQYIKAVVMDNPVPPWGNQPGGPVGFSGVRITNLSSLLMADCQIIHCGKGLDVAPTGTNTVPSIYCINTFFDNCVIGANFVGGTGFIYRNRFVGCWFSSNITAGVYLNGTINGLDFIGCEFYGNPVGIDAVLAQEWSVRSSRIAGNTTAGIRTTANAGHAFSVTDNVIGNVSGFGANAIGVNVQAGAYSRYQILDNRGLDSNTVPGTDLGTTTYASQKNVANNMGWGLITGTVDALSATKSIANTETEVVGFTAQANNLKAGTVIRFQASGIQSNTTATSTSVHRIRIGPVTLTGPVVGSWSVAMGATARTNVPFYIIGQITILSATTAIATLSVRTDGLAYAAPTTTIIAPVTIATNADQRVQLTTISGAATTTWNYFAAEVQVVKS